MKAAEAAAGRPEVTVVIPTRDRAALLPRAVDSVRAQRGVDWELIVADDGSADATPEALEPYRGDGRIRVLRLPPRGVSAARNAGAAAGRAPLLAFLDSDDEWLPDKLSLQAALLRGGLEIAQTEEIWIRRGVRVNPPAHAVKQEGDIFAASLDHCMITPSSVMMTRRLFEETGGFRADFPACEDYELWLRIASRHPVGLLRKQLLIRYGGHADQLSARYPALDRYRIRAIALLLDANALAPPQRELALGCLRRKLDIYRQGSAKRGREDAVAWCRELSNRYFPSS